MIVLRTIYSKREFLSSFVDEFSVADGLRRTISKFIADIDRMFLTGVHIRVHVPSNKTADNTWLTLYRQNKTILIVFAIK